MEDFIARLVDDLDSGKINRRQFCETLALAVAVSAAGEAAANAAPAQGFKLIGINHISYACPDYRKARDFYTSILGMENLARADNGRETRLMFGPEPGKGGSFLIPRNGATTTRAKAAIDHIGYTIPDWDETKLRAALTAGGLNPVEADGNLHVYDPFDYEVEIAGGAQDGAFRR